MQGIDDEKRYDDLVQQGYTMESRWPCVELIAPDRTGVKVEKGENSIRITYSCAQTNFSLMYNNNKIKSDSIALGDEKTCKNLLSHIQMLQSSYGYLSEKGATKKERIVIIAEKLLLIKEDLEALLKLKKD